MLNIKIKFKDKRGSEFVICISYQAGFESAADLTAANPTRPVDFPVLYCNCLDREKKKPFEKTIYCMYSIKSLFFLPDEKSPIK